MVVHASHRPARAILVPTLLMTLATLLRPVPVARAQDGAQPETPGRTQPTPAQASSTAEPLTLDQAAELARSSSPAIAESRANAESARQAANEAQRSRFPTVTLREIGVRTDSPADVFGMKLMEERFSFPAFVATDPNHPVPLNNYTTQAEASLPLFTGGQLAGGIRQAERMAQSAAAMQERGMHAVEMGVAEAYLNALLADRFVDLAERARATTARHVQKAQDFFDSGMIIESDLLQAKVQLSKMDQTLIRARNQAALARAGLNRAMGVEQDRSFALVETPASPDSFVLSYEAALDQAMRTRRDMAAVEYRVAAARAGIGRARGAYWPQLGVSARYSWNDRQVFGDHGRSYTLAGSAQWQIWDWGQTHARVLQSRSDYEAARAAERAYRQQVEFEVRSAWQGVEEARASLAAGTDAVRAAERAMSILEDRFGQGLAKTTDLLDAETEAADARVREAEARYDEQKAIRNLRFAVGLSPVAEVNP